MIKAWQGKPCLFLKPSAEIGTAHFFRSMNYPELRRIQLLSRKVRDEVVRSRNDSIYGVAADGVAICGKCCRTEIKSIGFTYGTDGWALIAKDEHLEDHDGPLFCGHCSDRIEPIYCD